MANPTEPPSQGAGKPEPVRQPPPPAEKSAQVAATIPQPPKPPRSKRRWLWYVGGAVGLAAAAYFLMPVLINALNTISTDDAYVNGHVTMVAPRVLGQVAKVYVDDNYRVKKNDLLVQLDKVPYEVQLKIKEAAVVAAEADLRAAKAQVRGLEAQARSQRWHMQNAMEQVANQIANIRAQAATYHSNKASLALAKANLKRGEELAPGGGISKENLDYRRQQVQVTDAAVEQSLQQVYATRASLGLAAIPPEGQDLTEVPPNLEQTFSAVRTTLANLEQTLAQIGLELPSTTATPKQVIDDFIKLDAKGDIDRILESLIPKAPAVKQGEAKLLQAKSDLDQAKLNLQYCDIISEIDGVVTRRNVNPGNNVQVGQSLMAVRSLTEIWIDANYKETQLADMRIGQRAKIEVDMYGRRHEFEGRITGFTMGTGQTLALLPPQNATGNFVKIVQRLPVRIELTDYNPNKLPLFVGLSCTPYVYFKEPAQGPNAGDYLQPNAPLPRVVVP
jgi:membrane fusion protein (multidrug efflux system)